jgi:hypothetical protein
MLEMKRSTNIGYAGNEKKNKHCICCRCKDDQTLPVLEMKRRTNIGYAANETGCEG